MTYAECADCGEIVERDFGCSYCQIDPPTFCSDVCLDRHYRDVSHPERDEEFAREARFSAWKEDHTCPF